MPWTIVELGLRTPRRQKAQPTTYLCDWPDCANPAAHVVGFVRELGTYVALCKEHAGQPGHAEDAA
jgi:hypothetical protein